MYVCMRQILSGLYIGTAIVPVSHKTLIALASAQKTASFQDGVDRGVGDKGHQIRHWIGWYGMVRDGMHRRNGYQPSTRLVME